MCEGFIFLADGRLIKQVHECLMGGPVSAVFSNIFCVKIELNVVKTLKPKVPNEDNEKCLKHIM